MESLQPRTPKQLAWDFIQTRSPGHRQGDRGSRGPAFFVCQRGGVGPNQGVRRNPGCASKLTLCCGVPKEKARRGNRASNVSCGAWL